MHELAETEYIARDLYETVVRAVIKGQKYRVWLSVGAPTRRVHYFVGAHHIRRSWCRTP
jgi:hypothetical protein